ncbi:hypothetical protein BD309DRAFT_515519 [Dichomitus squalens]|nr:hypothetical protein BD309DRAFT_515519 [Dichomitus squalens]
MTSPGKLAWVLVPQQTEQPGQPHGPRLQSTFRIACGASLREIAMLRSVDDISKTPFVRQTAVRCGLSGTSSPLHSYRTRGEHFMSVYRARPSRLIATRDSSCLLRIPPTTRKNSSLVAIVIRTTDVPLAIACSQTPPTSKKGRTPLSAHDHSK